MFTSIFFKTVIGMYGTKDDDCIIVNRCIKMYGCSSSHLNKLKKIFYCHQGVVIYPFTTEMFHYARKHVAIVDKIKMKRCSLSFLNSESFFF